MLVKSEWNFEYITKLFPLLLLLLLHFHQGTQIICVNSLALILLFPGKDLFSVDLYKIVGQQGVCGCRHSLKILLCCVMLCRLLELFSLFLPSFLVLVNYIRLTQNDALYMWSSVMITN